MTVKQTGSERSTNLPKVTARQVAAGIQTQFCIMPKSLVFPVSLFSNPVAFSSCTTDKDKVGEPLVPLLFNMNHLELREMI